MVEFVRSCLLCMQVIQLYKYRRLAISALTPQTTSCSDCLYDLASPLFTLFSFYSLCFTSLNLTSQLYDGGYNSKNSILHLATNTLLWDCAMIKSDNKISQIPQSLRHNRYLLSSKSMIIHWARRGRAVFPPGDIWQNLETFLVVTTWGGTLIASTGYNPRMAINNRQHMEQPPTKKDYLVQNVNSVTVGTLL